MLFKIGRPYLSYLLSPSRKRLVQAVEWMGHDIDDGILDLIEAVFRHVRVEANMTRPATTAELAGFTAPTLVIAAEKDAMFPGRSVVRRAGEIVPNLVAAECMANGTHLSSRRELEYINERILNFLGQE